MYYHLLPALFDRFLLNMIAVYIYFSTVIQRDFCSHALTICLHPFIHRSFRYGSKCGSSYESKCLLSLFHVSLSVICLMLSFDLQCVNV